MTAHISPFASWVIIAALAWLIIGAVLAPIVGHVLGRADDWPISDGVLADHDAAWEREFAEPHIPAQRTESPIYDGLAVEELYRDIEAFEGGTDL